MVTTTQNRTLEVLESYLYLKGRIYLDVYRNKLFKFLDTYSKNLDNIVKIKVKNFDMAQYAMFRDITEMRFDAREPTFSVYGKRHDMERPLNSWIHEAPMYEEDYYENEEN